jgi:hypothetical protein
MDARNGPGNTYWIIAGAAGWLVVTLMVLDGLRITGEGAAIHGLMFGIPAGILAGVAVESVRRRPRGWIALVVIAAAVLAGWLTLYMMEVREEARMWGPQLLF